MIFQQLGLRSDSADARRPRVRAIVRYLKDDAIGSKLFDLFTATDLDKNLIRVLSE
jgi:hypothetical protein